jgi:hypothetical protein
MGRAKALLRGPWILSPSGDFPRLHASVEMSSPGPRSPLRTAPPRAPLPAVASAAQEFARLRKNMNPAIQKERSRNEQRSGHAASSREHR